MDGKRKSGVKDTAPETEGARRATGVSGEARPAAGVPRDAEVPEKAQRRRFTAEYKLGIVEAAEACHGAGEVGALLRREGLYSSHLSTWRQQQRVGALNGLSPRTRGRKLRRDPQAERITQLEREVGRLREELRKAHVIIDVQKKVARLLDGAAAENEEPN